MKRVKFFKNTNRNQRKSDLSKHAKVGNDELFNLILSRSIDSNSYGCFPRLQRRSFYYEYNFKISSIIIPLREWFMFCFRLKNVVYLYAMYFHPYASPLLWILDWITMTMLMDAMLWFTSTMSCCHFWMPCIQIHVISRLMSCHAYA